MENKTKYNIGLMQGRLTPSLGRGVQFFPFDDWKKEFFDAKEIGLYDIEFNFDLDRYQENPIWSDEGVEEIKKVINETGVVVNHLSLDFFMRRPFFRASEEIRKENIEVLKRMIINIKEIGGQNVEIPLLDNSSIKNEEEKKILINSINECLPLAKELSVNMAFETDLDPKNFRNFLDGFDSSNIKAVYDTGNSASLGYDCHEEILLLGDNISNVHIKDRVRGGGTVALGTGDTDFQNVFKTLKEINYKGDFILQVARGEDGKEKEWISELQKFVERHINNYL